MLDLRKHLPEDEDLAAAMAPEELAAPLLAVIRASRQPVEANDALKLPDGMYPNRRREVLLSLAEAFAYLQSECLVVPYPPELHNYGEKERRRYKASRAADNLELPAGLETYRQSRLLPKELLHDRLVGSALPLYLRGDYETAVFRAMKDVEISVRSAARLPSNIVGVPLMRKAFAADQPLGSGFAADGERQALSDLFAGAMGYFRNSTGHRTVEFEAGEAARVVLFASQLLKVLDERLREVSASGP